MRAVKECVNEVPSLFDALLADDRDGVIAAKDRIFAAEQKADDLQNALRNHLPKSLFMPVDRRDLLDMLEMQDTIANSAQDIAGLMVERNMEVVDAMRDPLKALVTACVDTANHAATIIEELDELVEMGFSGREATQVGDMLEKLNTMEDETDDLGMALTKLLFEHEDDMKPVSVIFWYQLIQWIGDLADYSEKVGDRLRLLLAR
jgi:predicted phosphate transport protein (TIGR00153 family)